MIKAIYSNLMLLRTVSAVMFFLTLLFMSFGTPASSWNYREQSKIQWRDYGAVAFSEAKSTGKPLYILVYADWCHWCKKFETESLETQLIRDLLKNELIPIAINNDEQAEIASKLGTKLVPTSVILTPNGQRLLRFYGFLSAEELNEAVRKTLSRWRTGEFPEDKFGDESTCCPIP